MLKNSKLYSLQELMEIGIDGQNFKRIVIPKIQRSYAQGRPEEKIFGMLY